MEELTEGAVRTARYWIVVVRRMINYIIHKGVVCRKLRGQFNFQQMADLPEDRLACSPAVTFIGVDTFGPWQSPFVVLAEVKPIKRCGIC